MTTVPALAVVTLQVRSRSGIVAAALAWAGMLGLHLTEALVAGAIVALALLLRPGDARTRLRSLVPPAAAVLLGVLLAAPTVLGLLAKSETPQDPSLGQDPVAGLIDELLHPSSC